MAELSDAEVKALVASSLAQWYKIVYGRLDAAIKKQGLVLNGDLLSSLHGEIHSAGADLDGQLSLYFTDHGRYQDMKHRYQGKMPPIEAMIRYVEKVGIEKFRFIPGYKEGKKPKDERKIANRIAWGLSMSRIAPKNSGKTYGKKKWYAKTFWGSIDELIEMLLGKTAKLTTQQVIDSLK